MHQEDLLLRRRARLLGQNQVGTLIGLLVVSLLVAGVFALGGETAASGDASLLTGPAAGPALSEGAVLYNQYCSGCHGPSGAGNAAAGIPPLNQDGAAWQRTQDELQAHILDGGETMPELSGLVSPRDAALLIEFIQSWWTDEQVAAFKSGE